MGNIYQIYTINKLQYLSYIHGIDKSIKDKIINRAISQILVYSEYKHVYTGKIFDRIQFALITPNGNKFVTIPNKPGVYILN